MDGFLGSPIPADPRSRRRRDVIPTDGSADQSSRSFEGGSIDFGEAGEKALGQLIEDRPRLAKSSEGGFDRESGLMTNSGGNGCGFAVGD